MRKKEMREKVYAKAEREKRRKGEKEKMHFGKSCKTIF
jgi:hypothetical protein